MNNTNWGADQDLLYKSYIAYVRSKLNYVCFLYGSVAASELRALEVINNNSARLISGSFRSSTIPGVLADSKFDPPGHS
ncbi:hypothetical protein HHI36_005495, partial [Cryptolaemus montrouzieri]